MAKTHHIGLAPRRGKNVRVRGRRLRVTLDPGGLMDAAAKATERELVGNWSSGLDAAGKPIKLKQSTVERKKRGGWSIPLRRTGALASIGALVVRAKKTAEITIKDQRRANAVRAVERNSRSKVFRVNTDTIDRVVKAFLKKVFK